SSVAASVYGDTVTFTDTVAVVSPGGGTPGGTIRFDDGTTSLGTAALSSSSDKATLNVRSLGAGTHTITARYEGNDDFVSSTSNAVNLSVFPNLTTVSLGTSASQAVYGQPVTITVSVAPWVPLGFVP